MQVEGLHKASGLEVRQHHGSQAVGLCGAGLAQVKAVGLTVVFDHNYFPHRFFR